MAFNIAANQHGNAFVRLPEELDGSLCYGSVLLSILESAGYALEWAPVRAAPTKLTHDFITCVHGSTSHRRTFITILTEYVNCGMMCYSNMQQTLKTNSEIEEIRC